MGSVLWPSIQTATASGQISMSDVEALKDLACGVVDDDVYMATEGRLRQPHDHVPSDSAFA